MNPALLYKEEMNLIEDSGHEEDMKRWNELYEKSRKKCTHTDRNGKSSWRSLSQDLLWCSICGIND